jgi:hypothetical protein
MYKNIGILGCGTLGVSIARQLQALNKFTLRLSTSNVNLLQDKYVNYSMESMFVNNQALCEKSDIIFLGVRPQQFSQIKDLAIAKDKIVISLMSTIATNNIQTSFNNNNVTRIMTTIPELNENNFGIAGIFGEDVKIAAELIKSINIKTFILQKESTIDIFTVLVNLPYLISNADDKSIFELEAYLTILLNNESINVPNLFKWAIAAVNNSAQGLFNNDNLILSATKDGILAEIIKASQTTKSLVEIFKIALNKINIIREQL